MRMTTVQIQSTAQGRCTNRVRQDRTSGWPQRDRSHHLFLLQQAWASHSPMSCQDGPARPRRRRSPRTAGRYIRRCQPEASPRKSEFFKLPGDASDALHPSNPSQLYLAIASIFSFSVCKVKENLHLTRPYINVQIGPMPAAALYDSGADISCISETEFCKIPVDKRPSKIIGPRTDACFSAGGNQLTVTGIFNLPLNILGRKTEHPFRVIKGLNEPVILGADFINKHLLLYDPMFKQVKWQKDKEWTTSSFKLTKKTVVPEYSSRMVKIKLDAGAENFNQVISEISSPEEPYLVGGPGLVEVDQQGCTLVEIFNTGPEPVMLARGQVIGNAENASSQHMTHFQADVINSIEEHQWRQWSGGQPGKTVTEEFQQMCKLEVPAKSEEDYHQLLAKHRQVFSHDKNDIGYCDMILHKLFMRTAEPVYMKQFKIQEAHQHYLQEQVQEWLKLGIIQPFRSRYNSLVFLVEKKDGTQ
jgi:Retroviral aspartyl protease